MKKTETLIGVLSILFMALFGAALFLLPDRAMSEQENRMLKQAPALTAGELLSGQWGEDVETYMTDQFPLRGAWLGLKAVAERYALRKTEFHGVYLTANGRLIQKTDPPGDVFTRNLNALNSVTERLSVPVTVMTPPTAACVLPLPANAPTYDEALIMDAVSEAVGGSYIDVTETLRSAGEAAYFRTDHHWTMRGAYEAYTAYISSLGMEPYPLDAFISETVTEEFYGTSYAKACLWTLPPEPIEVLAPKEGGYKADGLFDESKLEVYDKYAYFLGGNQPLVTVDNDELPNGKTLVVIKDSYAHILAPLLSLHFKRIVLLDPRYINTDPYALVEAYSPDEVLVLFNAGNMGVENGLSLFLRY